MKKHIVYKVVRDVGEGNFVSVTPEFWRKQDPGHVKYNLATVPPWTILKYRLGGTYRRGSPFFVYSYSGDKKSRLTVIQFSADFPERSYAILRCSTTNVFSAHRVIDFSRVTDAVYAPTWRTIPDIWPGKLLLSTDYLTIVSEVEVCRDLTVLEVLR